MLTAPVQLPPYSLARLGYPGRRRLVAFYWEQCGDELAFDDGVTAACGWADEAAYLSLVRRPEVRAWLDEHGIHLGASDLPATHWLVIDAATGRVTALARTAARQAVVRQELPGRDDSPEDLHSSAL
jgi:hypothetical protein